MKLENQTILIVSNEAWGPVWYSKHNYANELSKKNRVYFVDPPGKWRFMNLFKPKICEEPLSSGLSVLKYNNALPGNESRPWLFRINEWLIAKRLRRFVKKAASKSFIFWSFDPYRLLNPQSLGCSTSIFHVADKYTNRSLPIIIRNSQYILCISEEFAKDPLIQNKPHQVLNHAVPDDFFINNDPLKLPLNLQNKKYILFVGTMDFRLDFVLIEQWAQHFSEQTFVFVGPIKPQLLDELGKRIFIEKKYDNIMIFGAVLFSELKHYIASAQICIAPMREDIEGNQINHQKLLQYLAWGKPVVCPLFSDYIHKQELMFTYSDPPQSYISMTNAIDNCENTDMRQSRINFALQYSFSQQFKRIETQLLK